MAEDKGYSVPVYDGKPQPNWVVSSDVFGAYRAMKANQDKIEAEKRKKQTMEGEQKPDGLHELVSE